jgi:prevent-host-death family protein
MSHWQLQDAKAHFSELIRICSSKGPQVISVRGKEEAVMLSKQDYEKLLGNKPSFLEFMDQSPLKGVTLDLTRDRSTDRNIDL